MKLKDLYNQPYFQSRGDYSNFRLDMTETTACILDFANVEVQEVTDLYVTIHLMMAYGGSRGIRPLILNLGSRWSEWSTSCHDRFTLGERSGPY
jgi:hypothetical protein